MGNILKPDKKALKILLSYNILDPYAMTSENFNYAKDAGLMYDPIYQSHDEAIKQAFTELEFCSKTHITNLFLASISSNRLEWRSGLPVYAIMQSFPQHSFESASPQLLNQCKICSSRVEEKVDLSFINYSRFVTGGVGYHIYDFAFTLKQHKLLPDIKPNENDIEVFSKILEIFLNANQKDTPTKMLKKLQVVKGFKSTEEQRRVLIDTLGYCSILESEVHKGFLHKYTNLGIAPRKARSSDWHYPVDWWEGKDGVNCKAIKFWFGEYEELKKYW